MNDFQPKQIIKGIENDGTEHIKIIGDLNPKGGSCGCCAELDYGFKSVEVIGQVYIVEDLEAVRHDFLQEYGSTIIPRVPETVDFIHWLRDRK